MAEAQTQATTVQSQIYPRMWTSIDYGILLPVKHSSIWLRGSVGASRGDRQDPFAQYFFGGFGNNWIDFQEAKRYRAFDSFPGTELNSIGGTTFGKLLVEWTLPPVRFRRFGVPNLYCTWAHAALFASAVSTNIDRASAWGVYGNIGLQADFKVVIFSRLDVTMSIGYAVAAESSQRHTDELMLSLKIL